MAKFFRRATTAEEVAIYALAAVIPFADFLQTHELQTHATFSIGWLLLWSYVLLICVRHYRASLQRVQADPSANSDVAPP
jgi:uncharacterized membrane protein